MNKWWKIIGVTSLALVILALGASLVFAQDEAPSDRPLWGDQDGDGVCDSCGLVPGEDAGQWCGMGRGGHMMGGWGGHGGWGTGGSSLLGLLAEKLDLTIDQLWDELSAGISVAELAANHNLDAQILVDELLAERETALAELVRDGSLSQEQAALMLEHMEEMLAAHINEPWTGTSSGFGRGGCHGAGGSFAPGASSSSRGGRWSGTGL